MASTPRLYFYEHCPYSARVRVAFGLKGVAFESVVLPYHDKDTPRQLSPSQNPALPILEVSPTERLGESLDIVRTIDQRWGGPPIFSEKSSLAPAWFSANSGTWLRLVFPRAIRTTPALPEFREQASVDYIVAKYAQVGTPAALLEETSTHVRAMEEALATLASQCRGASGFHGDAVTFDDLQLFGYLRLLTVVKPLEFPPTLRAFLDALSERSGVPLFFSQAN